MKTAPKLFIGWLILLFLVTFTSLLTYLLTQQSLRLGANELPVRLATATVINLEEGKSAESAIPADKIDISRSLDPFVMVYDHNKNLVATSGMMGSSTPSYPKGVLDHVDKNGEDRVTWQTPTGLRFATIAMKAGDNYVVAAYSLHEREGLIDHIGQLVLLAWSAFFVCSMLAFAVIYVFMRKIGKLEG